MSTRQELSDLIRAMARRDWGTTDRLLAELDQAGWSGGSQVISAAFAIAVDRRFRGRDIRDITQFVAETRGRYEDGKTISALAMEGMIRAVLGEAELVDGIDPEVAFSAQIVILGTLLQDEAFTEAQLEDFIKEVEATAARFM